MAQRIYYETLGSKGSDSGPYGFKIYTYDSTGNTEQIIHRSGPVYRTEFEAMDAAADYCEENGIDAELA